MKKIHKDENFLNKSKTEYKNINSKIIKTTDINILLNRVKMTQKSELKKRIIFLSLLLIAIGISCLFFLV